MEKLTDTVILVKSTCFVPFGDEVGVAPDWVLDPLLIPQELVEVPANGN